MKSICIAAALFAVMNSMATAEGKSMNEVRTYMSFSLPVDPAKIQTIPDMDLSYALAATLVEWGPQKQITAGLAEKWKAVAPNVYRFTLRKNVQWSDGAPVTAKEVKESLERGFKTYPEDLSSLKQMLEGIECPSANEIDFKLKAETKESGLLGKLTEPNYGILKIGGNGKIDLFTTTGAFALAHGTADTQLILARNQHWHRFDAGVPEKIIIRKTPNGADFQTVLFSDSWPNLIESSSLIRAEMMKRYEKEGFSIWKRPLDKLFYLQLGRRAASGDGRALLHFFHSSINRNDVVNGLSGYSLADQMFPRGYQLYNPGYSMKKSQNTLPPQYGKNPLEVVIVPERVNSALRENIRSALKKATGIEPHFQIISLDQVGATRAKGDFDIYAGTVGLADPDPEGAMSFYLEGKAPIILPDGNNFLERLNQARAEHDREKRLHEMRSILSDAVDQGYVLPLFHLSTVGIARPEIDLSGIPDSDESATLSKIRLKGQR